MCLVNTFQACKLCILVFLIFHRTLILFILIPSYSHNFLFFDALRNQQIEETSAPLLSLQDHSH